MQLGRLVADRFEVLTLAGAGGMGEVFRARDVRTDQEVALKVLRSTVENTGRFVREVHLLAMLHHRGIVRYVDHGSMSAESCYLAMEWLDGEDLNRKLGNARRMSVEDTITLGAAVADALATAHKLGIVHRDIKPSNLFLVDGRPSAVKILDFGVARLLGSTINLTAPGDTVGTPGFMAPEQARGEPDVDARADLFSLGCVLFRCLTGRPPFEGRGGAVLAKIVLEDPPRVRELNREVPESLDVLVSRLLAKDRRHRPQHAAEVAAALLDLDSVDMTVAVPRAITGEECQLVSVVMSLLPEASEHTLAERPSAKRTDAHRTALEAVAAACDAQLEELADRTIALSLFSRGATEQAVRAARSAIALTRALPGQPVALATGRAEVRGRSPVGEVIDRAAEMLLIAPPSRGIRIGELAAGLLPWWFEIEGDAHGLLLLGEGEDREPPPRTLLGRPSPCLGRDGELRMLSALIGGALGAGESVAVLIHGPAGIGKSRLVQELAARIGERVPGLGLLTSHADPMATGSPFGLASRLLRRECGIRGGEPLAVRQQRLRGRIARNVAREEAERVARFLGEVVGAPFDDATDPMLGAARRNAPLMADQVRRAFIDFVRSEATAGPLLLVLEDLQWADLPSLELLGAALAAVEDLPLALIATARPELRMRAPRLFRDVAPHEVDLRGLPRRAALEIARGVLGPQVPEARVERLVERSDGNPLLLEELLRSAAAGSDAGSLPDTVLAVVEGRLAGLDPLARRVLRAASVFGDRFWRGGVEALLGSDAAGAARRLERLLEQEFIARVPASRFAGEPELAFRHTLLREAAYAMLTEADRQLGHRLAAEWLEARGETDALLLAEHFERGGGPDRAVPWHLRAAREAVEANDLDGAVARAERGVACGASGGVLGELRATEAYACANAGRYDETRRFATEALALLPVGSVGWCRAAAALSLGLLSLGRPGELADLAGKALMVEPEGAAQIEALAKISRNVALGGQKTPADAILARATERIQNADAQARGFVHAARAERAFAADDLAGYLEEMRNAVRWFQSAGHERGAVSERCNLGFGLILCGRHEEAEQELRATLDVANELNLKNHAASAAHNLGLVLALRGEHEEAGRLLREAVDELARQGDTRLEGSARHYLAELHLREDDVVAAHREAQAVHELLRGTPLETAALAMLARIALRRGRIDEAVELSARALALADAVSGPIMDEAWVRLVRAEALTAAGRTEEAHGSLRAARERLLARAARIDDPELRRSFLEGVPENARTMALAHDVAERH